MYYFSRRILSVLFLGQLIAGVNREVLDDIVVDDSFQYKSLSREARQIMRFHFKTSQMSKHQNIYDEVYLATPAARRKRSLTSICPPHDSCSGRCGDQAKDFPFTCNCDSLCTFFSDCCLDYNQYCKPGQADIVTDDKLVSIPNLRCDLLFSNFNLLIVDKCPDGYNDFLGRKLCTTKLSKDCNIPNNFNVSDAFLAFAQCRDTVYRNCLHRLESRCNASVEAQCNPAIIRQCSKFALTNCRTCDKSFWPVYDAKGIVYKNSFCAICNSQRRYTTLSPHDISVRLKEIEKSNSTKDSFDYLARPCVPVGVDSCPESQNDTETRELCENYSGPVLAARIRGPIYKNKHCAMCHGVKVENLECATKASVMRGLIRPLLEKFIIGDGQGMKLDDIPAAFSILLNFGLDGRERMYFSSECEELMQQHQERCGKGRIWDPFSAVCRNLYCSTEFILVDYQCVRKETPSEDLPPRNESSILPDATVDFVHLSLSAEVEMLDFLQFNGQDLDKISETIRVSLAHSFNIHIERIKDVRFNISVGDFKGLHETLRFIEEEMNEFHPIKFQIDFDLYEDHVANVTEPEPSVDSIVSMLASSLSMNGFEFDINNVTSRIFEIHQTVTPLTTWCSPESGGQKTEYWNSDFSLILNDDNSSARSDQIIGVYVNKTGKFYSRGSFIADILFQGYQFSGNLINVSGVAVVCDWKSRLNESCIRILIEKEEYSISDNGSLYIHNASLRNVVEDSTFEISENDTLWVCLKSLKTMGNFKMHRLDMDVVQAWVSYVLLWISVVAVALVLITYISFSSLRNLPGCNTMNLTFSLMVMQMTFLFGQRSTVRGKACVVVAHILHYEILCCFMWMNVMAFDLFRTFGNRDMLSSIRSKSKHLPLYMIYSYLSPMLIILVTALLDYYLDQSPIAPHYGKKNICWITNQYSAIMFFAVPLAVIMLVNFIFFLLTIFAMRSVKNMSNLNDQKLNRKGRNDVFLYARMALVIGFTWALSFAAASTREGSIEGQILTYLFIIFNTLQGVFLFCVFVCNRRVYNLYREAFQNMFRKISKRAKHESSSEVLTRLKDAMTRSISTNTVISTLSNASDSSNDCRLPAVPERLNREQKNCKE